MMDAARVLSELRSAKTPLILAGSMMMRGEGPSTLSHLSAATGAPVVQMESPRGTNDPALGAFAEVLAEADLIALIGKKLGLHPQDGGISRRPPGLPVHPNRP